MRFAAVAVLTLFVAAGCGSQNAVHELTPIEEYALAQQIRVIELRSLESAETITDHEREAYVSKAQERFDRAKLLCEIAEQKLIKSLQTAK